MPVFQIRKIFPEVVVLPHHFDLYLDISRRLREILSSYFVAVEEYSIDECFALVDPSEVKYYGGAEKLLSELKQDIEKTLKVTYSLGLARTKALSKLASKLEKPGGKVLLLDKKDEIRALSATPIDNVWGIGSRTIPKLRKLRMETALDFVNCPEEPIAKNFSRPLLELKKELSGEQIFEVRNNADPRDQKSIQSTATFRPASTDPKIIWREMAENAEHACENARVLHLVANKISFFVKTSEFRYFFNEAKLPEFTSDPGIVLDAIEPKFLKTLPKNQRIRSTGIILHDLVRQEKVPLDLFGRQAKAIKKLAIEEAADEIRRKHGAEAIKRAASLKKRNGFD